MKTSPLAKRYARALFELADEKDQLESIVDQVETFHSLLQDHAEMAHFLNSPKIPMREKLASITGLLNDAFSPMFIQFLKVLIQKGRESYYPQIVLELNRFVDTKHNRLRVQVKSAVELQDEHLQDIQAWLEARYDASIVIETEIDTTLIGGIVVQVAGKVYDFSLKQRLGNLKKDLLAAKQAGF